MKYLLVIGLWSTFSAFARPGYVDFIEPARLKPLLNALPKVSDPEVTAAFRSPDTMWYDHASMVPAYQDSVTPILGVRANATGLKIAVDGPKVFDTNDRFHFPFGFTAGLEKSPDVFVLNFWAPPKRNGTVLPVVYWIDETTRWRWIFPKDTIFGEVMYLKDPSGEWVAFEIRTRKRYTDGWATQAYRPFDTAYRLSESIKVARPDWPRVPALGRMVQHLGDSSTLVPATLEAPYFAKVFEKVEGALDFIPDFEDPQLVRRLLKETSFVPVEGKVWKRQGKLEAYAASTQAGFSIVPRQYQGGLIPVNDVSCNRCHQETGRQIGEFSFNTVLYGEIWGEDRIFTWHLFDPTANLDGAFHQNRKINPKLKSAGLVENYVASKHGTDTYKVLPRPFKIIWR